MMDAETKLNNKPTSLWNQINTALTNVDLHLKLPEKHALKVYDAKAENEDNSYLSASLFTCNQCNTTGAQGSRWGKSVRLIISYIHM